ncbi:MAG: Rieske 2Fe-2S domain-containing protein [Novosphingobium sp.]
MTVTSDTLQTLEELPGATGFHKPAMPSGWFQVAWSDELKPGDVRPLKYFKKDYVLYRAEDGEAVVQSAFCPHMGAHLGHGGMVEGCRLKCPYHGWEWGKDGRNTLVPSEGAPSRSNRALRVYPTAETNGIVWMWHDVLHREPLWPAPRELRDRDDFLPPYPDCTYIWPSLRTQPQWIAENTVDVDHLIFVHESKLIPVLAEDREKVDYIEEGHIWRNHRELPLQSSYLEGIGVVVAMVPRDPAAPHRLPSILIHCVTPIDDGLSDMRGTVLVPQDREAAGGDGSTPVGRAKRRVEQQLVQAGRDVPIWENMVYVERPAYTRAEGPLFMKQRRFWQQFYPEVPA